MRRVLAAFVVCTASAALADLTVVTEVKAQGTVRTGTLSASGGRAVMDLDEAGHPENRRTVLRDGGAQKTWVIDHARKTVLVLADQQVNQVQAQASAMEAQMRANLARLPPAQRAQVEAALDRKPPAAAPAPVTSYEKKGTSRKVNGFACDDYVVKRDGKPTGEACFMPWKAAKVTPAEMRELTQATMGALQLPAGAQAVESPEDAPGVAVVRVRLGADGRVESETTLVSLSRAPVAAAKLQVPKGYAEKALPAMPERGLPPRAP